MIAIATETQMCPAWKLPPPPSQDAQLTQVKREEQEMLETQSIPLRNYLMRHVMPTLTQGLIEVCKVKPDDAVDYLVRMGRHVHTRLYLATFPALTLVCEDLPTRHEVSGINGVVQATTCCKLYA